MKSLETPIIIKTQELQKPAVLYHASSSSDTTELKPRNEKIRNPAEGPVVFATPDKAYASCFLVPSDGSWVAIGRYSDDEPWHAVVADEQRFRSLDRGGAIYCLPSGSFDHNPDANMGEIEWTSKEPVRPINKELIGSGLEAMIKLGVQVYFVNKATFAAIEQSPDHGRAILQELSIANPQP